MAASNSIAPFPPNIDRNHFASWLSGLTDGEGCFRLILNKRKPQRARGSSPRQAAEWLMPQATFSIRLRIDDSAILALIRSFLGCGSIYCGSEPGKIGAPTSYFRVQRFRDLVAGVIPHFDAFPLLAKKRNDYLIWREGVFLINRVSGKSRQGVDRRGGERQWSDAEIAEFGSLVSHLKRGREYVPSLQRSFFHVETKGTL